MDRAVNEYDELLNFFLTYWNYVSAVDVCNFLICRFHWALQKLPSKQDEAVRRVVRVRTFVAIRYWLLTFFTVDFIPNRELRLLFADWFGCLRCPTISQSSEMYCSTEPYQIHSIKISRVGERSFNRKMHRRDRNHLSFIPL